ncbi:MAG: M48 family metalloprotease [Burkholderiales bacterium]|nr:M48 family metalloprotease [Burkholderiales bacterium]
MSFWSRHPRSLRRWALALSLVALGGCGTPVVNPVTGRTERSVMTEADEIAEGRKGHAEVLQQYSVVADARLQAYVSDVGMRLARQSQRPNLPWTFTVLDSTEINAFALPGGFVYVTRGIMAYLDSEAELAGVLGHEIGHVNARHGAQRATKQQSAGVAAIFGTLLGVVAESYGVAGAADAAGRLSQAAAAGYIASYSRDQESQADELGAAYLVKLGFDPQNMVDVITVLKNQEVFAAELARTKGLPAPRGNDWLSSHPANDKRLADIKAVAAHYHGAYGDDQRARYLQAIDGMAFGDSREQGVVRGRNFYHEGLGIALTAPPGWRIDNGADAVTVVDGSGSAGLVVKSVPPQAGKTPEEVVRNVLKPVDGQLDRGSVNGLAIVRFQGQVQDAQGQRKSVRASVVSGPGGHNFLLVHAARDADAQRNAAAGLAAAEASFRALGAADRQAARPWVLHTTTLPGGGFAELARRSPLPDLAEQQLRLLNGAYGVGGHELRPGQRVKTIES